MRFISCSSLEDRLNEREKGMNAGNWGRFGGTSFVFESKSEISNPVHIASFASIFHAYGIPDFGKS
jgi:hypothetical protein